MVRQKEPIVDVREVVKRFIVGDTEITILKGISFQVYPGEFMMIVGPSGNGKSTLLNMITGIDHPSDGQVIVTGEDIHQMRANEQSLWRGKNVGIVFQFFQMIPPLSLVENVILPMELANKYSRKERKERALYLLERVGLADQADKLPNAVSGGQQQRAGIARAVANDPPLIIGDEPTGRLDPKSAQICFELFEEWVKEGKTMLQHAMPDESFLTSQRMIE